MKFLIPLLVDKCCSRVMLSHSLVASLSGSDACPIGNQEVWKFDPRRGWQHSFLEADHEIFSVVILSFLLIQEGQLLVSGERMCTSSGPSCSKLTMLLVNDSLKFKSSDTQIC